MTLFGNDTYRILLNQVAGWGKDEKLQPTEQLHFITVPIVNTKQCVQEVPKKFYRYLSFTTFCAGYLNGMLFVTIITIKTGKAR